MIGLSLSLCVQDILAGKVREEDVEKIVSNTCARTSEHWAKLLDGYSRDYWRENPIRAREITVRLRDTGKLVQPRLQDPDYRHCTRAGIWSNEKPNALSWSE